MATTRILRHECDRCHAAVETADDIRKSGAMPEGWEVYRERLLCAPCADKLRRFVESNEALEQSR